MQEGKQVPQTTQSALAILLLDLQPGHQAAGHSRGGPVGFNNKCNTLPHPAGQWPEMPPRMGSCGRGASQNSPRQRA
eukprot:15326198-Alexandrium_andersonii.AAC.1